MYGRGSNWPKQELQPTWAVMLVSQASNRWRRPRLLSIVVRPRRICPKVDSSRITAHSPENKHVSRLFSVTTDSGPLSHAQKSCCRSCDGVYTTSGWIFVI